MVSLLDPCPFDDPFVVRVEAGFEVGVGDDLVRQNKAPPGDLCASHEVLSSWIGARNYAIGWPSVTCSPASTNTPSRVPENADCTSVVPMRPRRPPTSISTGSADLLVPPGR